MIVCGDSRLEHNWPTRPVDCFVTSPPYCNGTRYGFDSSGKLIRDDDWEAWRSMIVRVLVLTNRKSSPSAMLWLNVKADRAGAEVLQIAISCGWQLRNSFAWVYSATVPAPSGGEHSFGHFQPMPGSRKCHSGFEIVYQFCHPGAKGELDLKSTGVPYVNPENCKRFAKPGEVRENRRSRGNVWCIPYKTKRNNMKGHPCPFPPDLVERCLRMQNLSADSLVMDPWCGTGITCLVAARMGFAYAGIELSPAWHAEAVGGVLPYAR